jgi:nicotinamidase-related amidase
MTELSLDKNTIALVVIDLQNGIAKNPNLRPRSSREVITNAAMLVKAFRVHNMPVFLVRVEVISEIALKPIADESMPIPSGPMPADWSDLVPELEQIPSDVLITKYQSGAFYGTDLDLQLRRRRNDTIVLCGIATDRGVESTARFAYEYGYQQVFAEDAMTSSSEERHEGAIAFFRRAGRVRATEEIIKGLD